ncbi:hypothetical protein K439DRAFT_1618602 [Ramaria rubella]|nr:hypothetical protein K439DRAFT_1618602 [Ramaria rubella]
MYARSVHNIRCERCWYDLNQGFGLKWKNFFRDLEVWDGLVPTLPSHVWLIQHLFLPAIQVDAELWQQVWNTHKMQLKGERDQSPREMFFFSMLTNGPWGLYAAREPEDEVVDDVAGYRVDWEEYEDEKLMANFYLANPGDHEDVFIQNRPDTLSVVEVVPPGCPLTPLEVNHLDLLLGQCVDLGSQDMDTHRQVWITALQLCIDILKGQNVSLDQT